jgi:hypothetical protein
VALPSGCAIDRFVCAVCSKQSACKQSACCVHHSGCLHLTAIWSATPHLHRATFAHLQEYNRSAPEPAAASPRMTRARRRKSMAADHLVLPDPGSAACLAEKEVEKDGRRAEEEGQPQREREQAQEEQDSGLAAEVAAISAGLCDQLEGCIEDSPEKQPRWAQPLLPPTPPIPSGCACFYVR